MPDSHLRGEPPIYRVLGPFREFVHSQASSGILLLVCTVIALVWANSPWQDLYHHILEHKLTFTIGTASVTEPLEGWINDGLMAIFFFVVGLEIKREILVGELRSMKRAMLPVMAAVGGMVVPAAIYTYFNHGGDGSHGWGVPMATDIAFAVGILSLAGRGAPRALTVFLTALAIADDLGAVLVIAMFYTSQLNYTALLSAAGLFLAMILANRLGVRPPIVYLGLGAAMWFFALQSGIHATVAGVLAALTVPSTSRLDPQAFLKGARELLNQFEAAMPKGIPREVKLIGHRVHMGFLEDARQIAIVDTLQNECTSVEAPAQRLEQLLHPWVAYAIMPVFALANAGVQLSGNVLEAFYQPITLGVLAGLVAGKPLGIFGFAWLAVKFKLAELPGHIRWMQVLAAGCLGGIGFTMSLFITALAFDGPAQTDLSKIGVLAGSTCAALLGILMLRFAPKAEAALEED